MPENGIVIKAIAATAAITLLVAGVFFYFFYRFAAARQRERNRFCSSFRREVAVGHGNQSGRVRGVIVDDRLDVLYLRKLEDGQLRSCLSAVWFNPMQEEEEKRVDSRGNKPSNLGTIHEIPLLHGTPDKAETAKPSHSLPPQLTTWQHPQSPALPPPSPVKEMPLPPPPPPPLPAKKTPKPPAPPIPVKRNPAPPPPPQPLRTGGLVSSLKPPTVPRGKISSNRSTVTQIEEGSKGDDEGPKKMKPLHWDKVVANTDHSLVWNEINGGSFRFDDDLMEALFGYNGNNKRSPEKKNVSAISGSSSSAPPAQIFILDPRKSQNTAIVLKSLATSRREILDALLEGRGLNADTLEKLTKISPTPDEAIKILQFNGNPTKLADAESFLIHILKAVPSAFIRINAMLFRSNYDPEILHLKETLQTLELGCKELRARGIFLKLLEAILKAGNRMNAGTARGNAQGFNLSALRKLSYVKSTDGKTTLLHFVVEQVIRSEGKRCVINRNHQLGRSNSQDSQKSDEESDSHTSKEERDKEYLMLGLPVLGGLSTEFSNVKKAANIDCDSFFNMCPSLTAHVGEIRELVTRCSNGERGGFVREMKGFLQECDEELKVVREEQTRVMEFVRRTTEFYQAGASKDKGAHALQIFIFVKDFLDTVDQVCIDITRKTQRSNVTSVTSSSPPLSPTRKISARFQNLHLYFTPVKTESSSSSESEDGF
ncbi:hypothetical protein LguiA_009536 [Lonicera macranthoides]